MTLFVDACYGPKMTKRREKRIEAALERCGLLVDGEWCVPEEWRAPDLPFPPTADDVARYARVIKSETAFYWDDHDDGTHTRLVICMEDDAERAERLVSELRCCGMTASIVHEDPLPEA